MSKNCSWAHHSFLHPRFSVGASLRRYPSKGMDGLKKIERKHGEVVSRHVVVDFVFCQNRDVSGSIPDVCKGLLFFLTIDVNTPQHFAIAEIQKYLFTPTFSYLLDLEGIIHAKLSLRVPRSNT